MHSLRVSLSALLALALLIPLPAHTAAAPGARQAAPAAETTSLWLHGAGFRLDTAVLDVQRGYVYMGMDTGDIARVRLSDVSRDGTLAAGGTPGAALIDGAGDFAYFAIHSTAGPNRILKLRLDDFSIAATIDLEQADGDVGSAVLDEANGYAYFGTRTQPGLIIQVRLLDFTRTGTLTLEAGEDDLRAAVVDPALGYAYFAAYPAPSRIVRVRLSDFTRVDAAALPAGLVRAAALDAAGHYAYFATGTDPGQVVKLRLADMTVEATLVLDVAAVRSAAVDSAHGFAYFGAGADYNGWWPGAPAPYIAKVRLSDFSEVGALMISDWVGPSFASGYAGSLVIDADSSIAYAGRMTYSCSWVYWGQCSLGEAGIAVVNLNSFTWQGVRYPAEDAATSFLVAGDNGYVGLRSGQVVQLHLPDFTRGATLNLAYTDDRLSTAVVDAAGGYAYFGTDTQPGKIIRVRLSDFTDAGVLTLGSGEDNLASAAIDPAAGYAYFGTHSGVLVKVRLPDFSRVGALALGSAVIAAALDPAGASAYLGLADNRIARVDLSTFTVAGSVQLSSYYGIESIAVDAAGGYAYAGTESTLGYVNRLRLPDLTVTGSLALPDGYVEHMSAAAVDPDSGVLYAAQTVCGERALSATLNYPPGECHWYGISDLIRLSDFQVFDGVVALPAADPSAAAFDPATHAFYVVTRSYPAGITRVRFGSSADLALAGAASLPAAPPGALLTYTFTLADHGPLGATGIALTVTLPAGTSLLGASPGCAPAGGSVICAPAGLRWGASAAVTVAVRLDDNLPPGATLVTTGLASAREPDDNVANNATAVSVTLLARQAYLPLQAYLAP